MAIFDIFTEIGTVFDFFKEVFSVLPLDVRLVYFYMFGILMFFGIYFMFKR